MAVFKCKMCGGTLEILQGETVAVCEYCDTKQTVPVADDEKKMSLFTRANKLRFACDFDKAAGIYESIIAEYPEEAESYWGLILCKYGIEYVDDPATGKKIPTCHRSSFESVMDDENFELVMENADPVSRSVYREEAKKIEELRKGIIEVSSKEEPYDIFICYKETAENGDRTIDSVIAQDVYDELTAKGYRVFFSRITLEDKLGQEYEPYIFAALNSAKVMLAFGTDYEYYNAVWVKNEWSRFLQLIAKGEKKTLIPCYKNIDAYDMPKEFAKLQAQDMGKVGAIQDLLRGIEKIIPKNEPVEVKETVVINQSGPNVEALLKRGKNALEDRNFIDAKTHFDKVLDIDAECAEAYLGLAMADQRASYEKDLILTLIYSENIYNTNYVRAKQYANEELLDRLTAFEKAAEEEKIRKEQADEELRIKKEKAAEIARIKREEEAEKARIREEKERIRKENAAKIARKMRIKHLASIREKNNQFNKMILTYCGKAYGIRSDGRVLAEDTSNKSVVSNWTGITEIKVSASSIVGLKCDGTVVATGCNDEGQCNVNDWKDIVSIKTSATHTVGLKYDGTVVATGRNDEGQCNINDWKDIVSIAAGACRTVGLKRDGTVVATGCNDEGQCNVNDWKDIVSIDVGSGHTVGLKRDGTVVVVGKNDNGQCNVDSWEDIVSIKTSATHTVGIKSDGTVVAVGDNHKGQCNVDDWKDIIAINVGYCTTVGLKCDGTLVAVGWDVTHPKCPFKSWTDIVAFSLDDPMMGLKRDGTVVFNTSWGSIIEATADWKLFNDYNHIEEERKQYAEQIKRIEAQKAVFRQNGVCQYCGGAFKGLFTKKCSNCGKAKDY